jgi:hypothetical protein
MKYSSSVNNYRETPYIVSDTFANKVNYTATIKGAIYFAIDGASLNEPSIFQANGTIWVPVGGYGIGTDATLQDVTTNGKTTNQGITVTAGGVSTNTLTVTSLTPKSIPFVGTADLITEDNTNLVWDNVNKWIGIQTNVPTAEVDIHTTTATPTIVINNTAGLASRIGFQNTNVSKWTIGNSAINTFNFYNSVLASIAAYFDGANNNAVFNGTITGNTTITAVERLNSGTTGFFLKQNSGATSNGYTGIGTSTTGATELMNFQWAVGTQANLYFSNAATWAYTFPNANGTIALTSNLSSYLPLAGGTLTGTLNGTSGLFSSNVNVNGLATSANYKLGVTGAAFIGGTNNKGIFITDGASYASIVGLNSAISAYNSVELRASGTDGQLFLHSSGRVSINSTTDDTVNQLQVTGSAIINGAALSLKADSTQPFLKIERTGTGVRSYYWGINGGSTLFLQDETGGITRITITSLGVITLTGDVSVTGTLGSGALTSSSANITNLAGTGSRAVLADASGNLSAPVSDQSIKENIQPLQYGLDTIMKLNPVQFEYIDTYKNYGEGLQIGNIAQDVEKIIPEAVFVTLSTGLKGIDYNQFNGIYIKAIQDQQKIIEGLIERIEQLENKY